MWGGRGDSAEATAIVWGRVVARDPTRPLPMCAALTHTPSLASAPRTVVLDHLRVLLLKDALQVCRHHPVLAAVLRRADAACDRKGSGGSGTRMTCVVRWTAKQQGARTRKRARSLATPLPRPLTALYVMQLFQTRFTSCLNSFGCTYPLASSFSCDAGGLRRGRYAEEWAYGHAHSVGAPTTMPGHHASCHHTLVVMPRGRRTPCRPAPPGRTFTEPRSIGFFTTLG